MSEMLEIYAQIKSAASKAYLSGIAAGEITPTTPLCFRDIALGANLEVQVAKYRATGQIAGIKVTPQGLVVGN
jgi:hypothetical protein